jgi:hypothetical protein
LKANDTLIWFATAFTLVFALFRFDGPAKGYWDTYITAPAMFMNQQPVQFVLKDGEPAFNPQLKGVLPDDLVDKADFGIITKDQRIGGGITASQTYALFGQFGFRLLFALSIALMVPLTVLVWREVMPGRDWAGLLGGLALAWNPYMLNVDRLNANGFCMSLILLMLYLLLRKGTPLWLIGVTFGVLAGIRNEAVCFVPAVMYWYLRRGDSEHTFPVRFGRLVWVGTLTVVALSPILYWKWYAFGHPLMHPSQYDHFQGFRPNFPHSFFGNKFEFNGLFNWPLHTDLVRTPHWGYPTYFLFPLVTVRAMGVLLSGLMLYGIGVLFKTRRPILIFLLAMMAPVYVLFGPQENWEEVKMTFMLLAWPPLGIFIAAGASGLAPKAPGFGKRAGIALGLALLVFVSVKALGSVEVPQDERWYVRFPNGDKTKNPAAQEGLAETERNDWVYFQSYETESEIARERGKLTAGLPWPAQYLPLDWDFGREWTEMNDEVGKRELVVLEIWGYIYGTRK